jgi:hypothetical protein
MMQGQCVPDRKFLDVAPHVRFVPWTNHPWSMSPDPGGFQGKLTAASRGSKWMSARLRLRHWPGPEFIDPVFTKTSPKRSFSLNRKRAFWLVFAKTGSIISGTGSIGSCPSVRCKLGPHIITPSYRFAPLGDTPMSLRSKYLGMRWFGQGHNIQGTLCQGGATSKNISSGTQITHIGRDETGSVYLPTQLERTLQLYWWG